ncbi:hypothetical protein C8R46DRAFT_1037652 [Mycena filopes]|nr:hypothetical protein C8R46DRAFT_1037652 [Mycena filopes]
MSSGGYKGSLAYPEGVRRMRGRSRRVRSSQRRLPSFFGTDYAKAYERIVELSSEIRGARARAAEQEGSQEGSQFRWSPLEESRGHEASWQERYVVPWPEARASHRRGEAAVAWLQRRTGRPPPQFRLPPLRDSAARENEGNIPGDSNRVTLPSVRYVLGSENAGMIDRLSADIAAIALEYALPRTNTEYVHFELTEEGLVARP